MIFLSIFTSASFTASISGVVDAILIWFLPFFATVSAMRNEEDLFKFVQYRRMVRLFVSCVGVLKLLHGLPFELIPVLESVVIGEQSVALIENANPYRNESTVLRRFWRAPVFRGIRRDGRSFGYAMWIRGGKLRDRVLACALTLSSIAAIFVSGSRGGYVSFLASSALFAGLHRRNMKFNRNSLAPAFRIDIARRWIFGHYSLLSCFGNELTIWCSAAQRRQAATTLVERNGPWLHPRILSNPLTGHGFDMGATVVGYGSFITTTSLDSYPVSLLGRDRPSTRPHFLRSAYRWRARVRRARVT